MPEIRLQKLISQMGLASRREAETWISNGRIHVNGELVTDLGVKVDPETVSLQLDGKPVEVKKPPLVYWLFNKPDQILISRKPEPGKPCIFELPNLKKLPFLVSPVGRLDFRTEGLLLLSNDGELVHRLSHPSYKLPRLYQVLIGGRLEKAEEQARVAAFLLSDDSSFVTGQSLRSDGGVTRHL